MTFRRTAFEIDTSDTTQIILDSPRSLSGTPEFRSRNDRATTDQILQTPITAAKNAA